MSIEIVSQRRDGAPSPIPSSRRLSFYCSAAHPVLVWPSAEIASLEEEHSSMMSLLREEMETAANDARGKHEQRIGEVGSSCRICRPLLPHWPLGDFPRWTASPGCHAVWQEYPSDLSTRLVFWQRTSPAAWVRRL